MPHNIIHIGFPKTATTFLQWNVFPNLKGIEYVSYAECRKLFQPIIYADPLDYSIEELKNQIGFDKNSLYSFESLTGSPFYYKGIGRSNIPITLKNVGFDKVIITIREQSNVVDSYYRQYVVQGGTLSFRNWLDLDDKRPLPQRYFQKGYLKYDGLIEKCISIFGEENVLILTQETLREDANSFIRDIERFTDSKHHAKAEDKKANESLSNLSITLLRFFNHFTFSSVRPFHFLSKRISNRPIWKIFAVILDPYLIRLVSKKKSYVRKYKLEQKLASFYQESNERLKEKWDIDFTNN